MFDSVENPMRVLFEGAAVANLLLDEAGLFDCNLAAITLFKCAGRAEILGKHISELSPLYQSSGVDSLGLINQYLNSAFSSGSRQFEWLFKQFDGTEFTAHVSLNVVEFNNKQILQATLIDISTYKKTEQLLAQAKAKFRALFNAPNVVNLLLDGQRLIECNEQVLRTFHYASQAELIAHFPIGIFPPYQPGDRASLPLFNEHVSLTFQKGSHQFEWLFRQADGTDFPAQVHMSVININDKAVILAQFEDISLRKKAEQELRIAAIAFELHEGVMVTDDKGIIIRANRAFSHVSGYSAEELIGRTPKLFCSGRHNKDFYQTMWSDLTSKGFWQGEIWNRRKDGDIYAEWLTISSVKTPEGQISHYIGIYSDITQHGEAEAAIYRLAYYDALTNLPNRRLLLDRTEQAMIACKRTSFYGAIIYLDLDNFKILNDTRGHDVGDELLVEVAKRLQLAVREGDTISRMGGDEFVILLENLSQDAGTATLQVQLITEKLIESVVSNYDLQGIVFSCSCSFGVRLFNQQDHSVDDLLKQADLAMYEAKRSGGNFACFFQPQMQVSVNKRAQMQNDLYDAIKQLQLSLHYQIQVNHQRGIEGVEALLRWQHPRQGQVPPGVFISLAEESDMIFHLGFWVLEAVCQQLKIWQGDAVMGKLIIAVNVSARQFKQAGFVSQIEQLLADYKVNPSRLKLELTESLLLDDVDDVISKMSELKKLGIHFSMDDFGAGYSSLANLKSLPLNQIKIDSSFIKNITTDVNDAAIAKTIIDMAKHLKLDVIAEGVETQEQADLLKKFGCYCYQGYLYSKPLTLDAFEHLLKNFS
ncbi:MAG: EAL domain-containing protein [Methylococcales bacterium]